MRFTGRSVIIHDGNVEKGLRKFKKKIQNSNLLQDLRSRETYVKPTTRRKTARNMAKKRWQRYIKDQQLPPRMY